MPRTAEEILKQIIGNQMFNIAQLESAIEQLKEEDLKNKADIEKLNVDIQKMISEMENAK